MITDVLLWLLVVAVLFQPTESRLYAAVIFAGLTAVHGLFLSGLDGPWYYLSAAIVDLTILWGLSRISETSGTILSLQRISLISIALNAMGCGLWLLYYPPFAYDLTFILLYLAALFTLLKKDRADVGHNSMDRKHPGLRFSTSDRDSYLHKHGGKI